MGEYVRKKFVKIRKPHTCFGCCRKFEPPAKMLYTALAEGGTVYSDYFCSTCVDIASKLKSGTEFDYGDFRDEALRIENGYK